ncbi:acetyl-CoA carboxylase biotin carboxylase subunit family protein [Robertmurraya beringensis]|uniref:Acetyl-CoA carboxylase biotin carboxylase subunit family protein n=1 Tax=Robertmurraya beringensis TaxID=641660 RepID=A0ABV6KTZ3_9BACI
MNKKNILVLGNIYKVKDYLDYENFNYHLITSHFDISLLSNELKNSLNYFGISTNDTFDVSCFENKFEMILNITNEIKEHFGDIEAIVSTNEATVVVASKLRDILNINRGLVSPNAIFLRDKIKMKQPLKEIVPLADFSEITEENYETIVEQFIKKYKKIVIKPSNQAGGCGIKIVSDYQEAISHIDELFNQSDKISVEQYINGTIMHFDGIIKNGDLVNFMVCKKIGSAYEYINNSNLLTTIVVSDNELIRRAKEFTIKCFGKFDIQNTVFHMEVIYSENKFLFLEVAGRAPGGNIVNLYKYAYGFDFHKHSYLLDLNENIPNINLQNNFALSLIPVPNLKEYTIKNVKGMDNLPNNIVNITFKGIGSKNQFRPFDPFDSICQIYFTWKSEKELVDTVTYIEENIKFECLEHLQ